MTSNKVFHTQTLILVSCVIVNLFSFLWSSLLRVAELRPENVTQMFCYLTIPTVETYDKKLCFGALESRFLLFPAGYIYSFGRGIRFSGQKCSIPASGGQQIGKTKPENFEKLRVSISHPMISYHMSPPY